MPSALVDEESNEIWYNLMKVQALYEFEGRIQEWRGCYGGTEPKLRVVTLIVESQLVRSTLVKSIFFEFRRPRGASAPVHSSSAQFVSIHRMLPIRPQRIVVTRNAV